VKITGAHDENDYGVAQRNNIPMYSLMDERAAMRADGAPYAEQAEIAQRIAEGREDWDMAKVQAMNLVPDAYRGLDRYAAREAVVADITAEGLAVMVEDEEGNLVPFVESKPIMQPYGDRSGVVIEPMLTDQWFVNAEELSKEARAAVADGRTDFVPSSWSKTYFNWLDNIEPWCISRQLWWGHQVPVWYGPSKEDLSALVSQGKSTNSTIRMLGSTRERGLDNFIGKVFCGVDEQAVRTQARSYYGENTTIVIRSDLGQKAAYDSSSKDSVTLVQDPDVLDTWFSSALWPFSTLGWPDETEELKTFYPGAVLVTAFDIIFFWVARMMMMGLKFGPKGPDGKPMVPFRDVYIHALVLDEKGQKMSKSKGNAMDPLELIDEYGADALRFTMARMAGMGRNIRLSKQAVEGNRNFSTKLWNAARFCQMNECQNWDGELDPKTLDQPVNRWIAGELAATFEEATAALEAYRFDDAAGAAYKFVWNVFCDWYLELIKPLLNGADEDAKAETRRVAGWTLDQILKLLHPFMPFVTEELWDKLSEHGPAREGFLMAETWPRFGKGFVSKKAKEEIEWVIEAISEIRSIRSDLGVNAGAKVPMALVRASRTTGKRLERHREVIERMARLDSARIEAEVPEGAIATVLGEATLALKIGDLIDVGEAKARLEKELKALEKDLSAIEKKLANAQFVAKAPPEVVDENRERLKAGTARLAKLRAAREGLDALA